jgi:hypothetical protein
MGRFERRILDEKNRVHEGWPEKEPKQRVVDPFIESFEFLAKALTVWAKELLRHGRTLLSERTSRVHNPDDSEERSHRN